MKDAFGNINYLKENSWNNLSELLITYEGRVAMCCYDWGTTYPIGYTNEKALNNTENYKIQ